MLQGADRATARSTEAFIAAHTDGWDELEATLDGQSLDELLERRRARPRAEIERVRATMYAARRRAVLVWSMGITQHAHGVDNVRADRQPRRWPAATSAATAPG